MQRGSILAESHLHSLFLIDKTELSGFKMRGLCTRCKEYRGVGEEWDIHFWENFPMCDKCGAFVDLEDQ